MWVWPGRRILFAYAVGYLLLQQLGLSLLIDPGHVLGYWPACGLLVAAFWWTPTRYWPLALLVLATANFGGNLIHGISPHRAAGFVLANLLGSTIAGAMLQRRHSNGPPGELVAGARWTLRVLLPSLLAGIGLGALVAAAVINRSDGFWSVAWIWFAANFFGALVTVPALGALRLFWLERARYLRSRQLLAPAITLRRSAGIVAITVLMTSVLLIPVSTPSHALNVELPLMIAVFVTVFLFGPRVAAVQLFFVVTVAVALAARGQGLFAGYATATDRVVAVQVLGTSLLLVALVVADLVAGRNFAEAQTRSRTVAVENALEGIATLSPRGQIEYINVAGASLLGHTPSELIGRHYRTLVDRSHPESTDLPALEAVVAGDPGQLPRRLTLGVRRKDGGSLTIESTMVPELDRHGAVAAVHCFVRDMTEHLDGLDRVNRLFTHSPELLAALDDENRFTRLNPAWTSALGHRVEDLLGHPMTDWVHSDYLEDASRQLAQVRAGNRSITFQDRYRAADGGYRWLRWNAARDHDGGQIYLVAHDITSAKITEQMLADARDSAIEASRLKSQFLATMSHEIRTPMNGVMGLAELLRGTDLEPAQRDYLDGIERAGQSLLAVINEILDFSKIEAGRLTLEDADLDLRVIVEEVIALLEPGAAGKGLNLLSDVDASLPGVLRGDPGRIRQVLLNLIGNAVKFTESGSVAVRVKLVDASSAGLSSIVDAADLGRPTPLAVRLEVSDTGIGMDRDTVTRLFQPFTQANASTTRTHGGTGLGLAICRQLVELMQGWISVESAPGSGTTFLVMLPLPAGENPGAGTSPVTSSATSGTAVATRPGARPDFGAKVLVVEDNEINQTVAVGMLTRLGCAVDVAGDGVQALEQADGGDYDLIFMDCRMPRMDGFTATTKLRERTATRDVPIVAMTANATVADREICLSTGMNDFLGKPVRSEQLVDVLTRWLGESGEAAPAVPVVPAVSAVRSGPVPVAVVPSQREPHASERFVAGVDERLEELSGDHSEPEIELVRTIVRSFLDRSTAILASLHEALAARESDLATRYAHSLKGASGNLGAAALADGCARVESAAADGDLPAAVAAAASLGAELDAVRQCLNDYLNRDALNLDTTKPAPLSGTGSVVTGVSSAGLAE